MNIERLDMQTPDLVNGNIEQLAALFPNCITETTESKAVDFNFLRDTNAIFQNGSIWLRADFHLHTKADKEFVYSGAENNFINDYVAKLVEQKIQVGVITNHNKFDKGEFVALKKKAADNGIGLFSGVEFSLKEGIHILIIFDDDWYKGQTDFINQFLDAAFYGIPNPAMPPYPNSSFDLQETVKKLDAIGRNYFIVLAHIDATNGLCEVLRGRTLEAFVKQEAFAKVLAIQKSGNKDNYNQICQYAERNGIACVEGSDNAHEGLNGIGKGRITYLKIGYFNFEALQYALTDHKNRLRPKDKPQTHNSYIKSISFQGGLLNGKQLSFSPELNNLIGIRGSGKSTILEIVRYALNIPFGSQSVDKEYKDDLIKHVLKSGGKAIVEIVNRHSETYMVERIYGQKEDIYKEGVLQQGITLSAILQQPVYFGQKDLSNKNADFEDDLVNKLIGGKLNDTQTKIENQKREIQRIINDLKSLGNLSQLKKETETTISNSEYKLKVFKENGVAEKLQLQISLESDINRLQNQMSCIDDYIRDLGSIYNHHEYIINRKLESNIHTEIFDEANTLLRRLKAEFDRLINILDNSRKISADFKAVIEKLTTKKDALKETFAKIKRDINIPELNPDDFIKINRELETAKLKFGEIKKSEDKRIELSKQLKDSINRLDRLWHEKFVLLQQEIDKINQPDGKLSIEVVYKGRKDKFLAKLQEMFRGSNIRGSCYETIRDAYADFIDMYKDAFRKLSDILNETQLIEFKSRFRANIFDLLTCQVENQIIIKFDGKPLKEHSLGQRASALILFLLSQKENDILIIDQPEDDLDNQTIYEDVIREIKKLKGQMQFIFATHNANIPVLGDSEMLIACQYVPDTEIAVETGSIDCRNIQEKVVRIMEGGKEAFDIRKSIYKIWEAGKI
jgi:ABC-type lipoprotein export system ATPase subunit